jgi:hypothetical protein
MFTTLDPRVILRVCPDTKVRASTGSMQRLKYSGKWPSGVTG